MNNYIDAARCGGGSGTSAHQRQPHGPTTPLSTCATWNQDARLHGFDLSGFSDLGKYGDWGQFTLSGVLSYVNGKNRTTGDHLYNIMPLNARVALTQRLGAWTTSAELQVVDGKTRVNARAQQNDHRGLRPGQPARQLTGSRCAWTSASTTCSTVSTTTPGAAPTWARAAPWPAPPPLPWGVRGAGHGPFVQRGGDRQVLTHTIARISGAPHDRRLVTPIFIAPRALSKGAGAFLMVNFYQQAQFTAQCTPTH